MKSKFIFLLVTVFVTLTGCSTSKSVSADKLLNNSIWVNLMPAELNNEKGVLINSLYFADNNKVFMKTGVSQESKIIAQPVISGYGTYTATGSLKKGIRISIKTEVTTVGKATNLNGIITPEGMILIGPDSTETIYYQLQTSSK